MQNAAIRDEIEDGNLIVAYDRLRAALDGGNTDQETCYLYVLTLARMGLTHRALEAYDTFNLASDETTQARAIHSRLLKDQALNAVGAERQTALAKAAESYHSVYHETGSLFPAINAASLYALAGETGRAQTLARTIIAEGLPETASYYDYATLAEAQAILGDGQQSAQMLTKACQQPGAGAGARAVTARQMDMVLRHQGLDTEERSQVLAPLSAGRAVQFRARVNPADAQAERSLRSEIQDFLRQELVAAAFGTFSSEADVIIAEEILSADVPLFLFLSAPPENIVDILKGSGVQDLSDRVQSCLATASEYHVVNDAFHGTHPLADAVTMRMVTGMAAAYSKRNLCEQHELIVLGATEVSQPKLSQTGAIATLRVPGLEPSTTPKPRAIDNDRETERREVSMLFADLAGFSALPDSILPDLIDQASGALADVLQNVGPAHLFSNTWGDAFFSVFSETTEAVNVAQSLLDRLQNSDLKDMIKGLRISLHHGLAMEIFDPVLNTPNYFGREVSRAARIEPITPPGCIYASEAFVLADMSTGSPSAKFEYVGRVELPKNFGTERLYLTQRLVT